MRPSDYPPKMREVFETFAAETGIPIRLVGCVQAQQAAVFAETFEIWELKLVVAWVKARIRGVEGGTERTGISRLSLQWHCMFGNSGDMALPEFQQRLGLAMEWAKKFARHLLPKAETAAVAAPGPVPVDAATGAQVARQLEDFKRQMRGGGA